MSMSMMMLLMLMMEMMVMTEQHYDLIAKDECYQIVFLKYSTTEQLTSNQCFCIYELYRYPILPIIRYCHHTHHHYRHQISNVVALYLCYYHFFASFMLSVYQSIDVTNNIYILSNSCFFYLMNLITQDYADSRLSIKPRIIIHNFWQQREIQQASKIGIFSQNAGFLINDIIADISIYNRFYSLFLM